MGDDGDKLDLESIGVEWSDSGLNMKIELDFVETKLG